MRYFKIFNILLLAASMALSCAQEPMEPDNGVQPGSDVIKAVIEKTETRTYVAPDGLTTYWEVGDKIGVYTEEGGMNFEFTANTVDDANKGMFTGSLNAQTPKYAYYPYSQDAGSSTVVALTLSNEQDASDIASYDFKSSNDIRWTGTDDYTINFTGLMSMISVKVNASGTPLAEAALTSVMVQALPLNGGDTPAVTGDFTVDLSDKTTIFSGDIYDNVKLVWDEPFTLADGIASAYMFVNPESISAGTPLVVTFTTDDGASASVEFTSVKDCQPNTRYSFDMNLAELGDKVVYSGNPFASISFTQQTNTRLIKSSLYTAGDSHKGQNYTNSETAYDIEFVYNGRDNTWDAEIPYLYDFSGLIATFETVEEGSVVYVDSVAQESGVTVNDYNNGLTYVVVSPSGVRQSVNVRVHNTGLPVVTIDGTVYPKPTDFDDIEGTTTIDIDGEVYTCGLRYRGNSTMDFPKKPYAFKLDNKASILGMPKHKRWVLLANWLDRTMLRNDLAFYLAQQTDTWAPHGTPVEVVLNGVHVGNYWLGEQIKIDGNRLDIADFGWGDLVEEVGTPTDQDIADNIGFLLECDQSADETEIYFRVTNPVPFYVYVKDPSDAADVGNGKNITPTYTYIKNYFTNVGTALRNSDWATVQSLLDYRSFADHWIFTEITTNQESKHPKSFYMHKDAGGKLCAGPAWDYDWGTFVATSNLTNSVYGGSSDAGKVQNGFSAKYTMWYTYLFNDPEFVRVVKERWTVLSPKFETAPAYLDVRSEFVKASDAYNHAMWPCTGAGEYAAFARYPNFDEKLSFDDAIAQMRTNLTARLDWLGAQISSL